MDRPDFLVTGCRGDLMDMTLPDGLLRRRWWPGLVVATAPPRASLRACANAVSNSRRTLTGQWGSQASPDFCGPTHKPQRAVNSSKLGEDEMDTVVEIVVTSRNVDVSDHFRSHVTEAGPLGAVRQPHDALRALRS